MGVLLPFILQWTEIAFNKACRYFSCSMLLDDSSDAGAVDMNIGNILIFIRHISLWIKQSENSTPVLNFIIPRVQSRLRMLKKNHKSNLLY